MHIHISIHIYRTNTPLVFAGAVHLELDRPRAASHLSGTRPKHAAGVLRYACPAIRSIHFVLYISLLFLRSHSNLHISVCFSCCECLWRIRSGLKLEKIITPSAATGCLTFPTSLLCVTCPIVLIYSFLNSLFRFRIGNPWKCFAFLLEFRCLIDLLGNYIHKLASAHLLMFA